MKKRLVILSLVVAVFAGAVVGFPDRPGMKPSRLAKSLPGRIGNWVGKPEEPGTAEKKKLAQDTEFERMRYEDQDGMLPSIQASIVFSGKNLSQSIHRPEVCLDAQGWQFMAQKRHVWEGLLPNGEALPVREILCRRVLLRKNEEGDHEDVVLPNGEKAYIWRVFYYTFFGHEKIVSGHYERTGEDIKDRLLKGYDQRWAYATFSSFVTKKHRDQGLRFEPGSELDEKQTEAHIQSFLKLLLPIVISEPGKGYDESLANGKTIGS
ncbi:MAG: exosortase-associated EpsI family protein [Akkermansiaceae bacterium]|nr:exosortase-associated EpsI family protein [Akkermansiaceae bacterium]